MDRVETQKIINKIKAFRQSFLVEKNTVNDWLNVLEPYAYEDVNNKLDDYFRESNNFGQYPDPYYLTKHLTKIVDKTEGRNITITCQICGEKILQSDYDKHYDRCSSVDYIYRMSRKHFHKTLNKQDLKNMDDEKFETAYWNFCDKLYERMNNSFEKHLLENAILSHKGLPVKYGLDELMEERLKGR